MPERRYDEKQVGAILQRAGEIKGDLAPASDANGLTLDELKRVAGEVGIEAEIVERAALEVATSPSKETKPSSSLMLDETVNGVLSEEAWEDATMNLRQFVGKPGTVAVHESTREWSGGWDLGNVTLYATTRQGKTRVRMLADTSGLSALVWTIGGSLGLVGSLITGVLLRKHGGLENLTAFMCAMVVLMFVVGLGHTLVTRSRKKVRKALEEQFATIVSRVEPEQNPLQGSSPALQPDAENLSTEIGR